MRPDEVDEENLSAIQLKHLNKLYEMQHKRALEGWYCNGGYFRKALNECQQILQYEMEGKEEIMERHSGEHVRQLLLNNSEDEVQVSSSSCHARTIDFLFEVKQTRTCMKKAKLLFKDLKDSLEVSVDFMRVVQAMIEDWDVLVKYHRKRTLTAMLHFDLSKTDQLRNGRFNYRIVLEKSFPDLIRVCNDGFNDNEIAIPHEKVAAANSLTKKDNQVTIESESIKDSKQ